MKFFLTFLLFGTTALAQDLAETLKQFQAHGLFTAGMYAYANGEKEQSEAFFKVAIEDDPTLARAHFHLGDLHFEKKEFWQAISAYERSIELDSKYVFAHYNLACAKAQVGEVDAALKALRRAVEQGYNRIETLKRDQDLAPVRKTDAFAAIIKSIEAAETATPEASFVLGDRAQKLTLLSLKADSNEWERYAVLALQDSSYEVRGAGYLVWAHSEKDSQRKAMQLTKGLFDNNGYVNKAAANALVAIGDRAAPIMEQIEKSNFDGAKFYATQVLRLVRSKPDEVK